MVNGLTPLFAACERGRVERRGVRLNHGFRVGHRFVDDLQNLALGVLVVVVIGGPAVPVDLAVPLVPVHLARRRDARLARRQVTLGREQRVGVVRVRRDQVGLPQRVVHHDVSRQVVGVAHVVRPVARRVVAEVHLLRGAPREKHLHALQQTRARREEVILVPLAVVGGLRRVASPRDDGDAFHRLDESVLAL